MRLNLLIVLQKDHVKNMKSIEINVKNEKKVLLKM